VVAVLEQVDRLAHATGAEVDGHHRLELGASRPLHELVDPDLVGLGCPPGQVEAARALLRRADAVLPAVVGDEVAAGVADDAGAELADQVEHVAAEPRVVGGRVSGLVDAGVDAATHVLDEGPEQAAIDTPYSEGGIERQGGGRHQERCTTMFASL
jgi:hypothetical protein